ncbi:MAG TPA: type II CAAX endopeptidase family protein [Candidatus Angelobacter sp.]|nr:type II CAAX endopeptidase family protein [Candidatus Angelobacter sp.]
MDLNTAIASPPAPAPRSTARFVFFNERGLRAGWRLLIFLAILAVSGFAALGVFGLLLSLVRGPVRGGAVPPFWMGLGDLAAFLAVVLASWIMSRIEHCPAGTYGLPFRPSALSRFAAGYVLWGFLPLTVVLVIMRALGVFSFGTAGLGLGESLQWALTWGFVFLMVGFFEEYSFRGYALYTLADGIGFWPAAIIMALIFGRAHMGNGGESYIGIVGTILFALFASATLRRTGNLWLAVGAHAGWNWGQSFFYGVSDSGLRAQGHLFNPPPPHGPIWLSGGTVGPEGSIVTLIVWGLMTIGFLLFGPRKEMSNLTTSQERSRVST